MEKKENKIASRGRIVWLYTKYQLITKGLLTLVIFPIASVVLRSLLAASGRAVISSGDYLQFLLSFQGMGLLILALILLVLLIGIDINAFIIMSGLVYEGRIKMTAKHLVVVGLRSIKAFLSPIGVLIMLYMAIVIPLVGVGVTISPMKNFQIPNFITDVIFKNELYLGLYLALIFLLTLISLRYIFFFHHVLLLDEKIGEALKNASQLMRRHWKEFVKDFVFWSIKWGLIASAVLIALLVLCILPADLLPGEIVARRTWSMLGLLVISELIAFVALMTVPIISYRLTELFYRYKEADGQAVRLKTKVNAEMLGEESFVKIHPRTKVAVSILFVSIMVMNIVLSVFGAIFFDEIFRVGRKIDIVAHRGGGDLAAENTVASLEAVIRENVPWSEIDVQRTKDGEYVINHDPTFLRVAGESRASNDLTLEEIKKLWVKDLFDPSRPSQRVATMEEVLDASKGRIGLFIELKGSTADAKMADDVIEMVRERGMENEVAILSLDYSLIRYVEENYPQMQTGFLYFFAIGKVSELSGDILIMEEREATPAKIQEIHDAGKKAIVWTVNTEESIDKFVRSEVDGIITDYVLRVKEGIRRRDDRTDLEILLDEILGTS